MYITQDLALKPKGTFIMKIIYGLKTLSGSLDGYFLIGAKKCRRPCWRKSRNVYFYVNYNKVSFKPSFQNSSNVLKFLTILCDIYRP